jgi:membrane-bound serine protease (ClpP class)
LLGVEAVMPGFGIPGIGGLICVIISIIMISNSVYDAVLMIVGTTAVIILIGIALYKLGIGKKVLKKFILNTEQKNEEGYSSNKSNNKYIGMRGITITPLRSSGSILVGDEKLDAVSEGDYIDKDASVEIISVEGRRIVVRQVK